MVFERVRLALDARRRLARWSAGLSSTMRTQQTAFRMSRPRAAISTRMGDRLTRWTCLATSLWDSTRIAGSRKPRLGSKRTDPRGFAEVTIERIIFGQGWSLPVALADEFRVYLLSLPPS